MKAVKKIEIRVLHKRTMPLVVYTMQGDTGREIECAVVDWDIPAGVVARAWVVKPSKKVVYSEARIVENSVVFSLTNQMLAEPGVAICIIEFDSGEDVVSSFPFNLCIDGSARGDGIPSENESTVLEGMFEALGQDAIKALDAAKAEAVAANKSAQDTEKIKNDFTLTAQQAVADVNNAGQTQTQRVNTAGDTQVSRIQAEGTTQVQNVQATAAEISADREQIHTNRDNIEEITHDILGIAGLEVDYETGTCTRLAGATGLSAGADFDRFKPYGGRRRCTVADNGTITSWYGDDNYVEDGSIGQVMVYQPKFYYKVIPLKLDEQTDGIGYHLRKARYYISEYEQPGFKCHPAFFDANGNETDYILYSAYEGSIYDTSAQTYLKADEQVADFAVDKFSSVSGVKPASGKTQNLTRPNVETLANNRGEGWHSDTIKAESANQLLMIIELGKMNLQSAIGQGVVSIADNPNTENNSIVTGGTSSLGNSTGMADGTNGQVSVSYRGVENPWGNIWKFVYGVNIWGNGSMKCGVPYICNDFNFAESKNSGNYESAGFNVANVNGYISAMGYSPDCDWLFIPSETLGNSSVPVGDYLYITPDLNGYRIARLGGHWTDGGDAGGFFWYLSNDVGGRTRSIGGRLVYVPSGKPDDTVHYTDIGKVAVTGEASGEFVTCKDSAEWPLLGMEVYGKTGQVKTTGTQLFDYNKWKELGTANGGTLTFNGYSVKLTATKDDAYTYYSVNDGVLLIPVIQNTTYTLSWSHSGAEGLVYIFPNGKVSSPTINEINTKGKLIFTTPEDTTFITFRLGVAKSGGVSTYSNIMLNAGDTALPWEPYTGAAPSPSPEYPQELETTGSGGSVGVGVNGTQLLDNQSYAVSRIKVVKNVPEEIKIENTDGYAGTFIRCIIFKIEKSRLKPGNIIFSADYVHTGDVENVGAFGVALCWGKGSTNAAKVVKNIRVTSQIGKVEFSAQLSQEDIESEDYTFLAAWCYCQSKASKDTLYSSGLTLRHAMVYQDGNGTWAPYASQFLPIPTPGGLAGLQVSDGADYNYVDEAGNKWLCDVAGYEQDGQIGILRNCIVWNPDAISSINNYVDTTLYQANKKELPALRGGTLYSGLCNRLQWEFNTGDTLHFYWDNNASTPKVYLPKGYTPTPEDFTFLGALMTPIFEPYPPEIQRKIRQLHTYDRVTHIWADENAGISARYVKNGNLVINNLQLDIAEQITDLQAQIDQLTINNNL